MEENSRRFWRILIFVGIALLLVSMLLWVGCFLPNWIVFVAGCLCVGVGLIGDIESLAHSRLERLDSLPNRRWLRTWPIVCRALMLVGVVGICLPLLALPPSVNSFNPDSRALPWSYINFAGGFCLVAGLFTSAVALVIRSRLLEDPLPLNRKQNVGRTLLLLGAFLLAGVAVFPARLPGPSYCGTDWDCDLVRGSWYSYSSSNDVSNLACSSHRYSAFWPPYLNDPSMTPFCPRHLFEWDVPCHCEQNRCVVNYRMFLK